MNHSLSVENGDHFGVQQSVVRFSAMLLCEHATKHHNRQQQQRDGASDVSSEQNKFSAPIPKPRKSKVKPDKSLLTVNDDDKGDDDDYANIPPKQLRHDAQELPGSSPEIERSRERTSYNDFEQTMEQIISDLDQLSLELKSQVSVRSEPPIPARRMSLDQERSASAASGNGSSGRKKVPVLETFKFSISSSSDGIISPQPESDLFVEDLQSNPEPEPSQGEESPTPELPPRKPPRTLPKNVSKEPPVPEETRPVEEEESENKRISQGSSTQFTIRENLEILQIEHLHQTKVQLQRSGYLWKTGPNLKNFKLRWCILYRHSLEESDSSLSYYFNRSSISASFSGKILLNDIEFLSVTESVSSKTRSPKTNNGEKVAFLEIGTRPRQGRVYLFAAKGNDDRQNWMHSLTQAISLHGFENKDLYHVGFVRAKFTVTTPWHHCLAVMTVDRYLYIFQVRSQSRSNCIVKIVDCQRYHAFNLRKTVKFSILDAKCAPMAVSEQSKIIDCRFGFSLTQTGGSVVYIVTDFEHFNARWLRAVSHLWAIPEQPDACTLNEQYLTKQNIPVAVEKCLGFLETFSQSASVSSLACLDSSEPMSKVSAMNICGQVIGELQKNAWQVHFLPAKFTCPQIALILLLFLRSMDECVFTESQLREWLQLGEVMLQDSTDSSLVKIKKLLAALPAVNYFTLRRLIIHLGSYCDTLSQPKLSNFLCKSFAFSQNKSVIISLSHTRSVLSKLIEHYVWLFEVTESELAKEARIRRVVNLLFNRTQQQTKPEAISSDSFCSLKDKPSTSGSASQAPVEPVAPQTLIIGVKVYLHLVDSIKQTIVNVHLSPEKTAQAVIESILDKNNKDVEIERYSLFEVVCGNRLERVFARNELVLPVVLGWSSWPASWAHEACLELRMMSAILSNCTIDFERPISNSNPQMLLTVIRYCSNVENRSTKKILAELSDKKLLLYTKDTNELLNEFDVREIYCYFGIESSSLISGKTSVVIDDSHRSNSPILTGSRARSKTCPKSTSRSFYRTSSSKNLSPAHSAQTAAESLPALTIVPKHERETRQCAKRVNFGHTFIFNSWPELEQWINSILHIQGIGSGNL